MEEEFEKRWLRGSNISTEVRSDVPLFDSYRAMAIANGVPPDDPALEGAT